MSEQNSLKSETETEGWSFTTKAEDADVLIAVRCCFVGVTDEVLHVRLKSKALG